LKATGTSAVERPAATQPDGLGAAPAPRSIGILGGTFNPPHLGHLAVACHARDELSLERVLLIPAHTAPHKSDGEGGSGGRDPGPEHRLRMCQLMVDGVAGLSVCAVEIERGGLSYTVDTLRSIHASHPNAELTLIVGADIASTLSSWREPAQLLELAQLAVAARDDGRAGEPAQGVTFLEMPAVEVSSSTVRRRAAAGEPIESLVGPAVAGYIAAHGLYRAGSEALS
jgi:nicotinate-nucleotide adenylyltransferase